jgi:hypothetical protein
LTGLTAAYIVQTVVIVGQITVSIGSEIATSRPDAKIVLRRALATAFTQSPILARIVDGSAT